VIAIDTNILVYAHRSESPFHAAAFKHLKALAESLSPWAIPWPCVHEFYNIVTNPRALKPPSTISQAVHQISSWSASPSLVMLHEGESHWVTLQGLIRSARLVGGQVHDARIAAICIEHRVRELWSADRDFNRFPDLTVRNPLVG
jgi:toxin-antitoxin system PIN domain toxin